MTTQQRSTRHFIRFFSPGMIVANTKMVRVDGGRPDPETVEFPDGAYAFEIVEQDVVTDGDDEFLGASKSIGPVYYHPDSKIETLDEVRQNHPDETILISNMETNGYDRIVFSRDGHWAQFFDPDKAAILPARSPR